MEWYKQPAWRVTLFILGLALFISAAMLGG